MEHVNEAVGRMHTQNKKHVTRNKMYMKHKISRIYMQFFKDWAVILSGVVVRSMSPTLTALCVEGSSPSDSLF